MHMLCFIPCMTSPAWHRWVKATAWLPPVHPLGPSTRFDGLPLCFCSPSTYLTRLFNLFYFVLFILRIAEADKCLSYSPSITSAEPSRVLGIHSFAHWMNHCPPIAWLVVLCCTSSSVKSSTFLTMSQNFLKGQIKWWSFFKRVQKIVESCKVVFNVMQTVAWENAVWGIAFVCCLFLFFRCKYVSASHQRCLFRAKIDRDKLSSLLLSG